MDECLYMITPTADVFRRWLFCLYACQVLSLHGVCSIAQGAQVSDRSTAVGKLLH